MIFFTKISNYFKMNNLYNFYCHISESIFFNFKNKISFELMLKPFGAGI